MTDIIDQLKDSELKGCGGADFPTGQKWQLFKNIKADKKYIICNAAESETGLTITKYLIENKLDAVVNGVKIALETFPDSSAYIYLHPQYFDDYKEKIAEKTKGLNITLYKGYGTYICGEETAMISDIEGEMPPTPRWKPPLPTKKGLWGCPTLVNNIETFYHISQLVNNQYKNTRLFSILGQIPNTGIYELNRDFTIKRILKETNNLPEFEHFVQSGGVVSGEILQSDELDKKLSGYGVIVVYNEKEINFHELMSKWADFFMQGNCDRCVPCREGVYRLSEMLKNERYDEKLIKDILFTLKETSLCNLGRMVVPPFEGLLRKKLGMKI